MADKKKIYNLPVPEQDKAAFLILCAAQEIQNRIGNLIRKDDLSMTQLTILHILDVIPQGKVQVKTIRELMVEDSPNVSRALNKLAAKKLITKERDTKDQRVVYVTINQSGRDLHHVSDAKIAGNLINISEKDAAALNKIIMKT
ncbi:MAG: MarR family transcriptional regulator [Deltaproteobacteria bacterium]|nr:MarR family transcriptional regulator [Deltaproteobacteria bacterium]